MSIPTLLLLTFLNSVAIFCFFPANRVFDKPEISNFVAPDINFIQSHLSELASEDERHGK